MSQPVMTVEEAAWSVPIACSECGRQTDPRAFGVRHQVTAWASRGKRGGFTKLALSTGTGRLMCGRELNSTVTLPLPKGPLPARVEYF